MAPGDRTRGVLLRPLGWTPAWTPRFDSSFIPRCAMAAGRFSTPVRVDPRESVRIRAVAVPIDSHSTAAFQTRRGSTLQYSHLEKEAKPGIALHGTYG